DLTALDPALRSDDIACAAYEPEAGYCDPMRATTGFVTAFERLGGRVVSGARVTGLRRLRGCWSLETTVGTLQAPTIVNAAGAHARWLASLAGVKLPIQHYAHDVAVFSRPNSSGGHLALYDLVGAAYYRPVRDGLTMVGSMNWSEGARVLDEPD